MYVCTGCPRNMYILIAIAGSGKDALFQFVEACVTGTPCIYKFFPRQKHCFSFYGVTDLNFSLLNFNNVNWESINNDFLNMNWDQVISCPLNDFPENFRKDVFSVLSRHCKINKVYNGKKVFLSRDIGRVSRKIFRLKSKIKYSDCNVHDREKFSLAISDLVAQKQAAVF